MRGRRAPGKEKDMSECEENKTPLSDGQTEEVTGGVKLGDLLQRGTNGLFSGTLEYRGGGSAITLEKRPDESRKGKRPDEKGLASGPANL